MTTYTIEEGIPIPKPLHGRSGPRGENLPRTPLLFAVDRLQPGQSVFLSHIKEVKSAEQFKCRRPDREYTIRKIPGEGWRVWRLA